LQAVTNATSWAVTDVWPGTVPVTAGTVYTISAWTKAGTRTANVALEVNWLNSSGTNLGRVGVASGTNSLTAWTGLSGNATAPAGAVTASIDVAAGSTSGETHWIDDITVTTAGTGSTGSVWSYPNLHGDVQATADQTGVRTSGPDTYDPYGTLITGILPDNMTGTMDDGWLGQHQRPLEHEPGIQPAIEMGARTYNLTLARFLQTDPIEGGSANNYDYVEGDPINHFDLNGTRCWSCIARHAWNATGGTVVHAVAQHSAGLSQIASWAAVAGYGLCWAGGVGCGVGSALAWASVGLATLHQGMVCSRRSKGSCSGAGLETFVATSSAFLPGRVATKWLGAAAGTRGFAAANAIGGTFFSFFRPAITGAINFVRTLWRHSAPIFAS
jgi:RHS repeat-associated protein